MPKIRSIIGAGSACALTLALTAPAAALAVTVTVRIQGKTKTLLPTKTLDVKPGFVTRGGAPTGACPSLSAQGALGQATHGNWQGSWNSSYAEYYVTRILGLAETGKHYYWGLYVNNRLASEGACDEKLKPGTSVVFAVVPASGPTEKLIGVQAPAARAGFPYTVQVVTYGANGKPRPLAGATVSVDGKSVVSLSNGWTPGITFPAAGQQTLTVAKAHYVGTVVTVTVGPA